MSGALELNLDAIVGPTHNYAGLSYGNIASELHRAQVSNPKAAALQGLAKMKRLADLGVPQAVLPPPIRPDVAALRALGFTGSDAQVLDKARRENPVLLAACASASAMWAANAATVSPSADTADGRVHFTPANLVSQFHRSLEPPTTAALLRAIFPDPAHFVHHPPLPAGLHLSDEGAANHTRLCVRFDLPGVEVFTFGRRAFEPGGAAPRRFPARQTFEASQAIARRHGLRPNATLFVQQHPDAIDAGVFHNDVICVGHRDVLLVHEDAFADADAIDRIARTFERECGQPLRVITVTRERLSLADAVRTYLFNSQLVDLSHPPPEGGIALICPRECEQSPAARAVVEAITGGDSPIREVHFVDVRQSMNNGGGPACLRLRVALTQTEFNAMHQGVLLTPELYDRLVAWVNRHYRDHLTLDDLADVRLLEESRRAIDELGRLLGLTTLATEGLREAASG